MPDAKDVQSILQLRVPVIVRIAQRQMSLSQVMDLAPGAMLELPRPADEPLDLMVNNKLVGRGEAVKVGENFGLKVNLIGDADERIRALGPGDDDDAVETPPPAETPTT
jgi:flagellar motor switch protein FliN/FliY